jgi:NAD(P)-dependent dehydrogenase (short-subunit alcohol dehydrogenase family)
MIEARSDHPPLTGGPRVAIVTGAGKGIGRACAMALASQGLRVVVNNRRHPGESDEETSAQKVVREIEAAGGQAVANHESVQAGGAGERMVRCALDHFGRVDVVVANAATPQAKTFHKQTLAEFMDVFQVGFFGALQLVHAAWPLMRANNHGRVIMMTSSAGRYGNHGLGAYAASKAAIEMLMRSLAAEAGDHDIRVNAVSPYATTQMTQSYLAPEVAACITPEAIMPLISWLASPACLANGEVLVAAGGRWRRAFSVETDSVTGQDIARAYAQLAVMPGKHHPSANQAFASLVEELRSGGQLT